MLRIFLSLGATVLVVWLCQIIESIVSRESAKCTSYGHFRALAGGPSIYMYQNLIYIIYSTVSFLIFIVNSLFADYLITMVVWCGLWLVPFLLASISLSNRDDGLDTFMRELFKKLKMLIISMLLLCPIFIVIQTFKAGPIVVFNSIFAWFISIVVILISIWIFLGGLKRLMYKIKKN
jgi:hypothetical protein